MVNETEFPLYMGFGRMSAKSIIRQNETASAEYCFTDKAVHRLTHDIINDRWRIEDIFDNTGSITTAKDLKEGVMRHFNFLTPKTSSLFNYFREQICKIGNIYFQDLSSMQDEGGVASYYPSGRLVILRLPIYYDATGKIIADSLINKIPYLQVEKRPLLETCEVYNTTILVTDAAGEIMAIPILMFEYIVTLSSLLDVVKWMVDNNLILPDLKYRLIIQEAKCKNEHSAQTFNHETTNGEIYTLLTKGYDETTIKFDDFHSKVVGTL